VERSDEAKQMIVRDLRDQIGDGRLCGGTALLTEFQLAGRCLISRQVVRHALHHLAADGLLLRVPGRGTFAPPPGDAAAASARDVRP
jgi:DNA-binding GntR family transcriptional regulator